MGATLLALAAVGLVMAGSATAATRGTPSFKDGDGLTITSAKQLDSRLWAFDFKTSALPKPVDVRILLPAGYAQHPKRHYPVLYLFDGTSGTAADWTTMGGAEQTTAGRNLIVVMPNIDLDGDGGGWCTNWPDGAEDWDTFHIDQLLPWVQANLRTINTRSERAIAGLSQGGFCSTSYAAQYPDLFGTVLSYSGAPDIYYSADARTGAEFIIDVTAVGLDGVPADSFFGDQGSDGINWAAHDPATIASNLADTRIYMWVGDGEPGPYDKDYSAEAGLIEGLVNRSTVDFHNRLDSLGISNYFHMYGGGTHSWPYWARDLRWSIGDIMFDFAHPIGTPSQISYMSANADYSQYGWTVDTHRAVREFSYLEDAGAGGFELEGSGSATVTTPPDYKAGRTYTVSMEGSDVKALTATVTAAADRRLTVTVPLGASNKYQEYSSQATLFGGTTVDTTYVTIQKR